MNTSDFDGIFGEAAWWGGAHPAGYISGTQIFPI